MTSSAGVKRSLADRVVLCADCDTTRTLSVSVSGHLVCSACGSDNWMHLPMTAHVKETVSIKGELTVEEDLTVEGHVEGSVELKNHNLWIGPSGKVSAEIHAKSVIVAGALIGNVFASELVEIRSSGSVHGNIRCPRISILEGAMVKGTIDTEAVAEAATHPLLSRTGFFRLSHKASAGRLHSKP